MTVLVEAVLLAAAVPVAIAAGYLTLLTLLSRARRPPPASDAARFDLVIPAHDEAAGIAATVASCLAIDYPRAKFRVLVVADNCTDDTAAIARAAGATVLVREDKERRGKGYALAHAFARSAQDGGADAVVVIDADTVASKNLLAAFASRIARGERAMQAEYAVRNPDASWRTRLMAIALGAFHGVRGRGREALGVSCGLRGNGMCFTHALLREVPHEAWSVVEDLEYGIHLAQRGVRVAYAGEAEVRGEMVAGEKASRSQRIRWEGGRKQLVRAWAGKLLREGLSRRSGLHLDLAMDLLVPPLATVGLGVAAGLVASLAFAHFTGHVAPAWIFGACALGVALYVLRGWMLSGTGARGLVDLALAPVYVAWKLRLRPVRSVSSEWVRTARQPGGETRP